MMQSDVDYFRGRAQEEIDASLSASSTPAREAHLELAHRYTELAELIEQAARPGGATPPRPEPAPASTT